MNIPTPTPQELASGLIVIAALVSVATLILKLWRTFFPPLKPGEDPVTRKEFDLKMTEMQERSDEHREKMLLAMDALGKEVARIGEALRVQSENFRRAVDGVSRELNKQNRSVEERLKSIEEHLRTK